MKPQRANAKSYPKEENYKNARVCKDLTVAIFKK